MVKFPQWSGDNREEVFRYWDTADQGASKLAPAGQHSMKLVDWQPRTNKNNLPYLLFRFEVVDGPYKGDVAFHSEFTTAKAVKHARDFCNLMGVDPRRSPTEYGEILAIVTVVERKGDSGKVWTEISEIEKPEN